MDNKTLIKRQLEAIAQMAPNLHEYNRGVLGMLGKEDLAVAHACASAMVELLVQERDALIPPFDHLFEALALPPEAREVQSRIELAVQRCDAAWAPIETLIADARETLEKADPFGMGMVS